ncbi:metal-dependent hydrolase [Cyclobacterium sp. 1_MG-2023]|uniref:metal-dependent hydrolase n=1 Tax=Cyclobacterium sp. 1_MG-2023 TaxID=3062681 RepID=UPI0026E208BC|nr:metal-dependent hydrolase [Cyclobacterium sp. 1_MG-2023]MDO6436161.1 metal-dependent hydrolase [Cyclobacterium sp. 1_MG-2023]
MIELKYFGHSTFLVEIGGKSLIFDPFISPNPLASDIEIDKIKTDYVLVSHGHEDHVFDVEKIVSNNEATLVSNFEIVTWYQNKGVKNVWGMNHGGSKAFDFGNIKYVNAIHSSALPDGSYGGNPGGFVIESEQGTFYFAGDTALSYDMKLIGESFDIDFAILPIGDNFTMGITDALKAAEFVGTDKIIGMHYDTFEPITIDRIKVKREAEKSGKELILLNIGESISL